MQKFMMRQEEGRRQHERELTEKQVERDFGMKILGRTGEHADKMEPWRDSVQPEAYLNVS